MGEELTLPAMVERYYSKAELRVPLAELRDLVDLSALERDFGWRPSDPPLKMTVEKW